MQNALDLRGQDLIGVQHFAAVLVSVVNAANAGDDMAQTPFGVVHRHTGARHQ